MAAPIKLRIFILTTLFFTGIFACTITKKAPTIEIGFTTLHSYLLNPDVSFRDTVNYIFIGNATDFHKMFYLTKASPGSVIVPDFGLQSVVAIVLRPTEKVVSVDVRKAAITGNELNVYYTITDTTSWKNYLDMPMVVATVPKSIGVKQVSFYSNGIKQKTIAASYAGKK